MQKIEINEIIYDNSDNSDLLVDNDYINKYIITNSTTEYNKKMSVIGYLSYDT